MSYTEVDESLQSVLDFLRANVPKREVYNITFELKKDFLLAKKKSKGNKRKPKKKQSKQLGRRDKKNLGFFSVPRSIMNYNEMLPLHKAWLEYINELFEFDESLPNYNCIYWEQFSEVVYKADFHGSLIHVVRSKCPSHIGKRGICMMETRSTFKILSVDNILTTVPKNESVFDIYMNNFKIAIFGMNLFAKPAERNGKRLNSSLDLDLL